VRQVMTAWRRPSQRHPLPDPYDTTLFVAESVREVVKTLLEAGVLVLLVVFIFLESWRATFIPMLASRCPHRRVQALSRSASRSTR